MDTSSLAHPLIGVNATTTLLDNITGLSTTGTTGSNPHPSRKPPRPNIKREPGIDRHEDDGTEDDDDDDDEDDDGTETNDPHHPNGQHHPIAEFLYQLTKMLTDDNNEIIEWTDGRIKVHYPERLEGEVLHKYFRHSKFASFQRQLNYFGFRKIAGKGKMSPCSYVNEDATSDIRSLLLIKRKTNGSAARKAALQQRVAALTNAASNPSNMMHPYATLPPAGLNFPGFNLHHHSNLLLGGGGGGATADQQQALANAMALLAQSGITTLPNFANINHNNNNMMLAPPPQLPPHQPTNNNNNIMTNSNNNSVGLQQLNLLNLQHQHQMLQKQLLNQQQQAQQNQAALSLLQSHHHAQVNNIKTPGPAQATSAFGDNGMNHNSQYTNAAAVGGVGSDSGGGNTATLEQLQAQLKALSQQQQQLQQQKNQQQLQQQQQQQSSSGGGNAFTALLNQVAANQVAAATAVSNNDISSSLNNTMNMMNNNNNSNNNHHPSLNLATAALNAQQGNLQQPATAAMNASIQSSNTSNSNNNNSNNNNNNNTNHLFDSAINLKSLLDEHKAQTEQQQLQQSAAAQALFHRLPSQSGLFHGNNNNNDSTGVNNNNNNNNMSTISLGNLLGSSNRLSSLLSLNSFLGSREASLADFTGMNFRDPFGTGGGVSSNNALSAQLTAAAAVAAAQSQHHDANNKYRSNN